jgi:hypothetical protein
MRTKATFLAGFATGYVLGARAGRARYEQIRDAARAFASNPTVQSTANSLQHQAGEALTTAKDKAAGSLGSTLQDKRPGWLGGQHESGGPTAGQTRTATGSNGHGA